MTLMNNFHNNVMKLEVAQMPYVVITDNRVWRDQQPGTSKDKAKSLKTHAQIMAGVRKLDVKTQSKLFQRFLERLHTKGNLLGWLDERYACPVIDGKVKASKFKPKTNVSFRSPHPLMIMATHPDHTIYRWGWVKGGPLSNGAQGWFDMEYVLVKWLAMTAKELRQEISAPVFACVKLLSSAGM